MQLKTRVLRLHNFVNYIGIHHVSLIFLFSIRFRNIKGKIYKTKILKEHKKHRKEMQKIFFNPLTIFDQVTLYSLSKHHVIYVSIFFTAYKKKTKQNQYFVTDPVINIYYTVLFIFFFFIPSSYHVIEH